MRTVEIGNKSDGKERIKERKALDINKIDTLGLSIVRRGEGQARGHM